VAVTEETSPAPLRVAAAVILVQGAGLVAAGAVVLVEALVGHPHDRGTASFLGALVIFYGAVVLAAARGLVRRRAWAGTPSLMLEFFAVVVGVYNLHNLLAVSVVLLASAAVAFAGLLHPASQAVLRRERR
jgi:hypothetical protein